MGLWQGLRDRITRWRAARPAEAPLRAPRLAIAFDSTAHTWLFRVAREREAISEFCGALDKRLPRDYAGPDALHAFQVAFDELLTNVVMHADGPTQEPMEILLKRDAQQVTALLRYRASPYDPTAREAPDVDAPLVERKIGGLGVHLVRTLMQRFEHRHVDGWNEITLARARDASMT